MPEHSIVNYRLTLTADVVVALHLSDPGVVQSALYIPGSMIRGAIAGALTASSPHFHDLILGGEVRWQDARPTADGTLGIPVTPNSWRLMKSDQATLIDRIIEPSFDEPTSSAPAILTKPDPAEASWQLHELRATSHRHINRGTNRRKGRATKDDGALFSYAAIAEGQEFVGAVSILAKDTSAVDELRAHVIDALESSSMRLGRSKNTQYGGLPRVRVDEGAVESMAIDHRYSSLTRALEPGDEFLVYAQSDIVLREPHTGTIRPRAIINALEQLFPAVAVLDRTSIDEVHVGGFNRHWGRPLPTAPAVASGTVIAMRAAEKIDLAAIQRLGLEGLGERRTEGYGSVGVYEMPTGHPGKIESRATSRSEGGSASSLYDHTTLSREINRRYAERLVYEVAARHVDAVRNLPSRSLLSRVRNACRELGQFETAEAIAAFVSEPTEGKNFAVLARQRRSALSSCHLPSLNIGLDSYIAEVATAETDQFLARFLSAETPIDLGFGIADLDDFVEHLRLRLIDETLSQLCRIARTAEVAS